MAVDDHNQPLDPEHDPERERSPFASPRFDRLVRSPAARRLSSRRLLIGLCASGAVAWGGYEGGTRGSSALGRWIAAQPEYRVRFDEIALDPPPPPYILRGARGILDRVRREGNYAETVSTLGLDLDRLGTDLKRNFWIERVIGVRSSHHRLTIEVTYRQPVALVSWAEKSGDYLGDLIDRNGVALPMEGWETAWAEQRNPHWRALGMAQPLVEIYNIGKGQPDRSGLTWRPTPARPDEPPADDSLVQQAAHLADFLLAHHQGRTPRNLSYPAFPRIYFDRSLAGFVLIDARCCRVVWGSGPGDEAPEEPKASEKWAILGRFIDDRGSFAVEPGQILRLKLAGAVLQKTGGTSPARPARGPAAAR